MNTSNDNIEIQHSSKIHASYALGSFFDDFLATTLSFMVFKFYETEIFLHVSLITIVVVIYGIWNMFNDPLAGHISNLQFKFMRKHGKRFTWFLLTGLPTSIVFVFIFMPLQENQFQGQRCRCGIAEEQHPVDRPHGMRQNPSRPNLGPYSGCSLYHCRCHLIDGGGVCRRGRGEYHPQPLTGGGLRCGEDGEGDRLHR